MIAQKSVEYAVEVDNMLLVVEKALVDIVKLKKSPKDVYQDISGPLLAALMQLGELSSELQNIDAVAETVWLRAKETVKALQA